MSIHHDQLIIVNQNNNNNLYTFYVENLLKFKMLMDHD